MNVPWLGMMWFPDTGNQSCFTHTGTYIRTRTLHFTYCKSTYYHITSITSKPRLYIYFIEYTSLYLIDRYFIILTVIYIYFIIILIYVGIGHWNPSLITSAAARRNHLWFSDCNQDAAAILHQCAASKLDQPTEKTWLVHKRWECCRQGCTSYQFELKFEKTQVKRTPHCKEVQSHLPECLSCIVLWQSEALQDLLWWPETIYSIQYTSGAISCIQSPITAVPHPAS